MPDTPIQLEPLHEPVPPPAPPLPCIACGYDLAGLQFDGLCPECATPIAKSIEKDHFSATELPYLRRLHLGVLLASDCATLSIPVLTAIALVAGEFPNRALLLLGAIVYSALRIAAIVGLWLFTSPRPNPLAAQKTRFLRTAVRFLAPVPLLAVAGGFTPLLRGSDSHAMLVMAAYPLSALLMSIVLPPLCDHYTRRAGFVRSADWKHLRDLRSIWRVPRPSRLIAAAIVIALLVWAVSLGFVVTLLVVPAWVVWQWIQAAQHTIRARDALKAAIKHLEPPVPLVEQATA